MKRNRECALPGFTAPVLSGEQYNTLDCLLNVKIFCFDFFIGEANDH